MFFACSSTDAKKIAERLAKLGFHWLTKTIIGVCFGVVYFYIESFLHVSCITACDVNVIDDSGLIDVYKSLLNLA